MRHELDHIDEQIIKLLHENARIPLKTIASQAFLSSPAVSARIERLEQAGIITGYTASCNNVIECNCVTGDYAMLVEVMFKSTEELDHFIGELQTFGSTKTQIVFSTSVEHRGIPLSTEEE